MIIHMGNVKAAPTRKNLATPQNTYANKCEEKNDDEELKNFTYIKSPQIPLTLRLCIFIEIYYVKRELMESGVYCLSQKFLSPSP